MKEKKVEEYVLEEKILALTPVEKEIMEFCSLFPRGFTKEDVFSFRPYSFLEKVFSRLEEMKFIRFQGDGVFIFLQPWKNLVYAKIPELRAMSLHAFLAHRAVEEKRSNFDIAFHFSLGQEPEKGMPFVFQAVQESKEKSAFKDSLSLLQCYSSLIPKIQNRSQKFEFFSLRGELHFSTENFTQSIQDFMRALSFAHSPFEKGRGALKLALAFYENKNYQEVIRVLEENKIFLQSQVQTEEIENLFIQSDIHLAKNMRNAGPSVLGEKERLYLREDKSISHLDKVSQPLSLLGKFLDLILEEIPSERALSLLFDSKCKIVFRESRSVNHPENKDLLEDIIKKAVKEKNPVIINNLKTEPRFRDNKNVITFNLERVICLPFLVGDRMPGAIYLERKEGFKPFSRKNLEFLIAISKPISLILKESLEFKKLKEEIYRSSKGSFIGQNKAFHRIQTLIDKVKDNNAPVFIWGESGTGKELVARAIHFRGARKKGKFMVVNCGAIPEHLLEAELFGYIKGAFTGAFRNKTGLIEEAAGGSFFLDEIGDLSLHLQSKLLRLLQEKEIRKIGENKTRYVDVRFICATNKNIEKEITRGNFREDLYYRLKIITIEIPPLRKRKDDILILLNHFIEEYCREMKRERVYFSPRALELLIEYNWPGNVRELENEVQKCLIFAEEDNFIKEENLSSKINPEAKTYTVSSHNFFQAKAEFEKRFLNQALTRWNYNKVKTAEEIGLTRQGLFKLMKKHHISVSRQFKIGKNN